jgi:hypothetical protein
MDSHFWHLAAIPLIFLPIMLLFRFTGCSPFDAEDVPPTPPAGGGTGGATDPKDPGGPIKVPGDGGPTLPSHNPPDYAGYILGKNPPGEVLNPGVVVDGDAVIGYWRLIETDPTAMTAKDEKATRNGIYVQGTHLDDTAPTGALGGSEAAPGNFAAGQTGLIVSEPSALCRTYYGAYVTIPYSPELHTEEFTIEAWVNFPSMKPDYEHMLIDTGGRYLVAGSGTVDRGYRIFADRDGAWQVRMATNNATVVFKTPPGPPLIPKSGRSHFALVMKNTDADGEKKDLTIYVNGKETATATIPSYALPENAPLYIAAENTTATPTGPVKIRAPFLAQIQEVVLHKKPLAREEIENHVNINRPKA